MGRSLGTQMVAAQMAEGNALPLASRTGNGNSGNLGPAPTLIEFEVQVTVAGTTLAVTLEESNDGSAWSAVGAAVNQNGVGTSAAAQRSIFKRYWRFAWAQTGADYTFRVGVRAK